MAETHPERHHHPQCADRLSTDPFGCPGGCGDTRPVRGTTPPTTKEPHT